VIEVKNEVMALDSIKSIVSISAKKYKDINSVILFGSYAKGNATGSSDIDLMIELSDTYLDNENTEEDAYWRFWEDLEKNFQKKVDLLAKDGVESSLIGYGLLDGGIKIYEKEGLN